MKIVLNGEIVELTPEEVAEFKKELGIVEEEPTYKEQIIKGIRTKYSVDDEIALLRQRESKPEEFNEYFNFVEAIKAELKGG